MERPDLPREPKRRTPRNSNKKSTQSAKPRGSKPKTEKLILATPTTDTSPPVELHAKIARRAYELYAERGYRDGHAEEDWLEAEQEILNGLERS
ncbi:MAG: DUF2934 domain-containing protein [Nitrospiraceae bacterium]|nr:DUF2934 domain-containing protein [Nitrospiraceae bacterium]